MIDLLEARARIRALARLLPVEELELAQASFRVLATDLIAPRPVPGFANSAMDGYALRHDDLAAEGPSRLAVIGVVLAGAVHPGELPAGAALRITTGAALPEGADTVVIKEQVRVDGDTVEVPAGVKCGANVRAADDDYAAGALALPAGTLLRPEHIGVLASFGCTRATLCRRPRAMVFSTGDELVAPGSPLPPGRRYDSNQPMLAALLPRLGVKVTATGRLPDDPARLGEALLRHAGDHDLLITTGGVSAGEADFLPGVLGRIGTIAFWKVAMRPGMPVLCGTIGDCLVLALPGNPVSVYATALALLRPWLAAACGAAALDPAPTMACLAGAVDKRHDRVEFRRGLLRVDADGVQRAEVLASVSSGALSSVAAAEVLIEFPATARRFEAGERLPVHRLP